MRKFNDAMNRLAVSAYVKGGRMKQKIAVILARKEGEGFVDTALKILISVVVGALCCWRGFMHCSRTPSCHPYAEDHESVYLSGVKRRRK